MYWTRPPVASGLPNLTNSQNPSGPGPAGIVTRLTVSTPGRIAPGNGTVGGKPGVPTLAVLLGSRPQTSNAKRVPTGMPNPATLQILTNPGSLLFQKLTVVWLATPPSRTSAPTTPPPGLKNGGNPLSLVLLRPML